LNPSLYRIAGFITPVLSLFFHQTGVNLFQDGTETANHQPPTANCPQFKKRFVFLALVAVLTTLRLSAAVHTVSVPDCEANPGTVLQVPLVLDNASGLAQVRLQLNFDPQVLTLVSLSPGVLGSQFDLSCQAAAGTVTMDFVRTTPLPAGSGYLALVEFVVNAGATTNLYSDLAIARIEVGDATGVRTIASPQNLLTQNGSDKVSLARDIDNAGNGLPDWWEMQYGLDVFGRPDRTDSDGDSLIDFLEYAFGGHP
jgi:hypothetical protein